MRPGAAKAAGWGGCLRRVTVVGAGEVPLAPQGRDHAVPVDWLELHGATPVRGPATTMK
jgi:hypothetical protein